MKCKIFYPPGILTPLTDQRGKFKFYAPGIKLFLSRVAGSTVQSDARWPPPPHLWHVRSWVTFLCAPHSQSLWSWDNRGKYFNKIGLGEPNFKEKNLGESIQYQPWLTSAPQFLHFRRSSSLKVPFRRASSLICNFFSSLVLSGDWIASLIIEVI